MEFDDFLSQSKLLMDSNEMQTFNQCINNAASFHLSEYEKSPFLEFHKFITIDQSSYIEKMKENERYLYWHNCLVSGFLGNVQNSFACVRYHQGRIQHIESLINDCFTNTKVKNLLGTMTVGGGNTLVLDFEYQSYVLAYRRVLDQFAFALAAFFKNRVTSFNGFQQKLKNFKPKPVSLALAQIIEQHLHDFSFVISSEKLNSVRDRIAHFEFVAAGVVNISSRGLLLAGGGEKLGDNSALLHEVLERRTSHLFSFIEQAVGTFIMQVKNLEGHD